MALILTHFPVRVTLSLLALLALSANALATPQLKAGDGFNLRLHAVKAGELQMAPERDGFAHNWFAGRLSGLPTNVRLKLTVDMSRQSTANAMNVGKWKGLRPFYTYANPASYDAYTGFWRDDQGQWWSRDPFLTARQRFAGNADTPQQRAIHPALAPLFLSDKGAQWFPWQEIEDAKPGANQSFVMRQTFYAPDASVAMRVPFTSTYLDQYVERLKAADKAGVKVDEVGQSSAGRRLWSIRVDDAAGMNSADRPTIVIFAREHATEHATSWSALGALERLMDRSVEMDALRAKVSFVIVPLQDPDGAAFSRFENMTNNWDKPRKNARLDEVLAYSRYFRDIIEKENRTLDVVVSLHNVEANEAPNFMAPFAQSSFRATTEKLNKPLFAQLKEAGYTVASPNPSGTGVMSMRLYGWLAAHLGAMDVAYEVNDRDPENRLSVAGLKSMGALLAEHLGNWTQSEAGNKRHAQARAVLEKRVEERTEFYAEQGQPKSQAARDADLLTQGF